MDEFEKVEQGIIEWNKSRGNTEFNLDNEMRMLLEEVQEYFSSDDIIDKFDAFLDYEFVSQGSYWKYDINNVHNFGFKYFLEITGVVLWNDFKEKLEELNFPMNHFFNFTNDGLEIVLKYNNKKSSMKDKNGKIIKPENFVGPEKELEKLFNEYMKKG